MDAATLRRTRLKGSAICGLLALMGCASPPAPPASVPPAPQPVTAPAPAPLPAEPTAAEKFAAFIADERKIALEQGITPETYDRATAGLSPLPQIEALYQNQPEFSRPVWDYLDSAVSDRRVQDAASLLDQYSTLLLNIQSSSGVPAGILVAIWGMESDYGRNTGGFNLFGALATLAYDGPMQNFARPEFLAALKIMQTQNYTQGQMTGSWAGAFGQTQFTPTTFMRFATDGDGDGKIDLWFSPADALASAAKLLENAGWEPGKPWGLEVRLPAAFPYAQADPDIVKPAAEWSALGVTAADGTALASQDEKGAIYLPAGARGPAFLVFDNFKVILKYNNAASYALAVGLLADRARGAGAVVASWPRYETPLSRDERLQLQTDLKALGFDPGAIDGITGRQTRAALRLYETSRGLITDGYATRAQLLLMEAEAAMLATG